MWERDPFIVSQPTARGIVRRGKRAREGAVRRRAKCSTSIGCLLFSLPLLASLRISPRRPIGIELHVQLAFPARQLVILGLLLASERMPLYRRNMERKEKCTSTAFSLTGARKTAHGEPNQKFCSYWMKMANLWLSSQNLFCGRSRVVYTYNKPI